MATVICPCVGDTHIQNSQVATGGAAQNVGQDVNYGSLNNYRYGSYSSYVSANFFSNLNYTAILQFDLTNVLMYGRITSIKLVQSRSSVPYGNHTSTTVNVIRIIGSEIIVEERITYNNSSSLRQYVIGTSISDSATSGIASLDITQIFSKSYLQEDTLSLELSGSGVVEQVSREGSNGSYPHLVIETGQSPGPGPINLLPVITQNPRADIVFSWWHNPDPNISVDDPQIDSELTIWQDAANKKVYNIAGTENQFTLPANTFTDYRAVYFQVRTQTQYNGWGNYSATASFPLGTTPPLAPTLIFPLNVSVSGLNGVMLEWTYNSPYDTFPTRFDVRYRIDGGAWITCTNNSTGSNPAYSTAMTDPIDTQSTIEWQVMAYGALGDAGPWSNIGTFFTIGVPNAPVIVRVSNSNRPRIYFSAVNMMSWEIEILQDDKIIYSSSNQPFMGEYSHETNQFFLNGNYIARMRITNEYGLTSDWGVLPFTVATISPEPLKLKIISNPSFYMRLHFNNDGKTVYIYRSELRKNNYLRIGVTKEGMYDDYTARSRQRYEYYVRVVNPNWSFADSNVETGSLRFIHTTIAEYDTPSDMLMFWKMIDGKPTKNISFDYEKTLTQFVGREFPVLQVGNHANKSFSLSFYCTIADYERLEQMHRSYKVLVLRDWRLGTVYGTINGSISANRESDGVIISFVFTQCDFSEEVELT